MHTPLPEVANYWYEDWQFASQWLIGPNPIMINAVTPKIPLPSDLNLTISTIKFLEKNVLQNETLRNLIKEKR